MNKVHSKLYELMIKFDELCRQHGIEYYLSGGTMIGAIRHQGFIPWDDDVDLYISRNNYKKLLACKDSFFDENFVLVNDSDFSTYGNTIRRCVDTTGTSITKPRLFDGTPKGEFLELFILDPLPDEPDARNEWLTKHWIYTELMAFTFRIARPQIEPWINEDLYRQYYKRYKAEGREVILRELESELFNIEESEVNDWCSRWGLAVRVYPIEWFGKPRRVPFEDTELPVQACVERVLRYEYGDTWANIPYIENQKIHPIIRSQSINYHVFVDDYLRYVDEKELFRSYEKRDELSLDTYFAQRQTRAKRLRVKEAHMRGVASRLGAISTNEDVCDESFAHAFDLWRAYQFSSDFWQSQICLDIQDDSLALFLDHLFAIDGFSPVKTILEWRKRTHTLSTQLVEIDSFVQAVSEVYTLIDEERLEQARALYNSLINDQYLKHRPLYDMRYLDVLLEVKSIEIASNSEDLLNKAQALVDDFPESGDALFLLGKIENYFGLIPVSNEHLTKAKKMTRNAFFLREIDKLLPNLVSEQVISTSDKSNITKDAQAILIKLLSEIHEACLEDNIPYFLANENALSAYRCGEFESDRTRLEVVMLFKDAFKLSKKLSNRPGRAVESMYTNKKYPDISFRYCDTETTRVTLDSRNLQYENRCLCIHIAILKKPYRGFLGRVTRRLENTWNQYQESQKPASRDFSKETDKAASKRAPGFCRALLKPLFRHSQRNASFDNKLYIRLLSGERKDFRKNVFSGQQLVSFEGQPCFIAAASEKYFSDMYGKRWKKKKIKPRQEKQSAIVDTRLPYAQFLLDVKAAGETLDFTAEYAKQTSIKKRYDAIDKRYTRAWNIAWRTEAKFRMKEFYAPHKQEIITLRKQEKWPELIELFSEYNKVAVAFQKENLSVCFDDELFDIYLDVLREQGRKKLVASLEKLSSEEKSV